MVWRLTPNNSATCSCVSFFSIRAALILLPISCSMPLHLPCTFIVGEIPYIVYQTAFTSLIMCVKILLHLLCFSLLPRQMDIYRFQSIQLHAGREPTFILFRRQGSHGIPLVLHPFLQPRKLFFG